jgi:hypothetical protein
MFSFFSAMNFLSIKGVGAIHPSLKTYYFGLFSTVICLIIAALGADQDFFKINYLFTDPSKYCMTKNQFYGCLIVGFFSWSA